MSVPGVFDSTKSIGSLVSKVVGRMAPSAEKAAAKSKGMSHFMTTVATVVVVGVLLVIARIMINRGNETDEDKRKAGRSINNVIDYTFIVLIGGLLVITLVQQLRFAWKVVKGKQSFQKAYDDLTVPASEEFTSSALNFDF